MAGRLGGPVKDERFVLATAVDKRRRAVRQAAASACALTLLLLLLCKRKLEASSPASSPAQPVTITAAGAAADGTTAGGTPLTAASNQEDDCPVRYERLTMEELAAAVWTPGGQRPYLFGAEARPNCTNCRNTSVWGQFCQYKSAGPVCPEHVRQGMLAAWVARGFELPLTMTPCDLWRHIKGRTLYMMGDSMMLDYFKAMKCFMFEFWPSLENAPLTANQTLVDLLTCSTVVPRCARLVRNTSICYIRTDEGQNFHGRALPALLENGMFAQGDILIANFGLHHGTSTYQKVLDGFAKYYKENVGRLPRLFWQQTLAQHFDSPSGEFNGGKPPFKCHAIRGFKELQGNGSMVLEPGHGDKYGLRQGLWRNRAADAVMRAAGIPLIQSFNETVPMWSAHRDNGQGYECTHPCHPALSQISVAKFYLALEQAAAASAGKSHAADA